jgi:hypothetical protein
MSRVDFCLLRQAKDFFLEAAYQAAQRTSREIAATDFLGKKGISRKKHSRLLAVEAAASGGMARSVDNLEAIGPTGKYRSLTEHLVSRLSLHPAP